MELLVLLVFLFFSFQWTFENFNTESDTAHGNPKFLQTRKLFFCFSEYMKEHYRDLLRKRGQINSEYNRLISETFFPINGAPILDTIGINTDKDILKKYGLPKERPIVIFFPPNVYGLVETYNDPWYNNVFIRNNRLLSFLRTLYHGKFNLLRESLWGLRYRDLLKSVNLFCKKNDAFLVVKVREKNRESHKIYRKYSDFGYF